MTERWARGRRAWGYDSRTGEKVLLRDLVRDGQTGLPVLPRNYEPKHPQETPVTVHDPIALRRPAPDLDRIGYTLAWPTMKLDTLFETNPPLTLVLEVTPGATTHVEVDLDVYELGVYELDVYE